MNSGKKIECSHGFFSKTSRNFYRNLMSKGGETLIEKQRLGLFLEHLPPLEAVGKYDATNLEILRSGREEGGPPP